MKKWLFGLTAAGFAAGTVIARRFATRVRTRDLLEHFLAALEHGEVDVITNETSVDLDAWRDAYEGVAAGRPFRFWMEAPVGPGRVEKTGAPRRYGLLWDGKRLEASARVIDDDDPHPFERVHDLLRREYHRRSGTRPS